jgi:hypothetical protein
MPYPSVIGPAVGGNGRPWRRHSSRRWTRDQRRLPADLLLAVIPSLPRASLARITERLIDRMDEIDGDPDMEDLREDDEDSHDRESVYE